MAAPQAVNPIDGVIDELRSLIGWTLAQPSRIGYFASLYLRVTTTIRSKIGTDYFDDDSRMETLDAAFASRYLSAVQQFRDRDPALPKALPQAWAVALDATNRNNLIIVQHLLLPMNPHINIDLAVASARTCPGNSITAPSGDFDKINAILASVVPTAISELGELSPYLHLLADLSQDGETSIINFSLVAARDASWDMAQKLAYLAPAAQEEAHVSFGPISFLFREHDIYPATVIDGGMRNVYHIRLLGTRFLGDYRVQPGRQQVRSTLTNEWATDSETLNKLI